MDLSEGALGLGVTSGARPEAEGALTAASVHRRSGLVMSSRYYVECVPSTPTLLRVVIISRC